ncbi:YopX family protein [Mammaliicoccus sciuri]|uniref:YopX family protein n=1 Tax=Mammaliicoccus sciuri TaxID=1296 RepID=UPI003F5619CC
MKTKFKFWDKDNNEFILFPHNIVLNIDGTVEGIEYEMPREGNVYNDITYFELLQSTGLFDKNGKEIFEGDIIDKGYSNIDIVDRIGYVKFGTGDDSDGYLNQEWLGWTTNNDDSLLDVHEHCTVLGNKFEHPHLLGED